MVDTKPGEFGKVRTTGDGRRKCKCQADGKVSFKTAAGK
jgi:hypothetical protein